MLLNKNEFELICLNETWLSKNTPDSLLVPDQNYTVFRADRPKNSGGSAILTSSALLVTRISVPSIPSVDLVCVDIHAKSQIRLINCYVKPGIQTAHMDEFIPVLANLISVPYMKILVGDFNLPNIFWTQNKVLDKGSLAEKRFFDFICINDFSQLVNHPTRNQNILDLVMTDRPDLISDLLIGPPFVTSDHCMVSFKLEIEYKPQIFENQKRSYDQSNFMEFNLNLSQIDWIQVFREVDTVNSDSIYSKFCEIIHEFIDIFVPIINIRPSYLPSHIQNILDYREKLWKRIHYPSVNEKFKRTTLILQKESKRFFQNKEKRLLSNKSPRQIYRYVSSQIKSKNNQIPGIKDSRDQIVTRPLDKANFLLIIFRQSFPKRILWHHPNNLKALLTLLIFMKLQ